MTVLQLHTVNLRNNHCCFVSNYVLGCSFFIKLYDCYFSVCACNVTCILKKTYKKNKNTNMEKTVNY